MGFKRKGRISFLVVCSVGLCCYFFRYDLLVLGFDFLLKRKVSHYCSQPISYERMKWEGDKLVAFGVHLADEQFHLTIDRLETDWTIDWSDFYIQSHFQLIHPELTLVHHQEGAALPFTLGPLIP